MLKLMKLEIKKFKLKGYIKGVTIANLVILAFILFINYASKYESEVAMDNYQMAFTIISAFIRVTFIVFASVIISRLIIDEYKNKTITVLFMYPINRRKIIIAKLIIVVIFAFISIIISNVFVGTSFYLFDKVLHFVPDKLTINILISNSINTVMCAFADSFISLIPLYFGMRKKSVPATITSAIIIASVISSNNGGFTLYSIIAIPIALAVIGAFIGYLAIRNIEHMDIAN
ncbi:MULTISPECIES: ABC transporter permease [unclassified Clostridium]|uniref:ABC transporter permease n=1 Tax=unclassified Clostridium TaxID=2614128 RepID=UPI000297B833|nr:MULTISPECIES: ABC transporter permease [unclassified Clostridium]EKQ57431.1 MAG: hypothetical protein A370_00929 [Clostridium sp. Maddingley MBC34-26]